jgi:hypothetical protein
MMMLTDETKEIIEEYTLKYPLHFFSNISSRKSVHEELPTTLTFPRRCGKQVTSPL